MTVLPSLEIVETAPENLGVIRRRRRSDTEIHVGVFAEARAGRKTRYSAYTRDYSPQWKGCCEHTVEAGPDVKKRAIEQHKTECVK